MSAIDGGSGRESGAIRTDGPEQGGLTEAQARAEEIHAEVARTEVRRVEDQAARADEAVEEAERKQKAAHQAEEQARDHARAVSAEAEGAVRRVSGTSSIGVRTVTHGGGDPIVFGPFTAERPELLVAAAFVGGFLLAKIIRGMAS